MSPAVVGIDLGTTCTKVLVQDLAGRQLSLLERPTPWLTTATGGTETSVEVLLDTVVQLMRAALEQADARSGPVHVLGVAVAGFAESGVLVDASGRPGSRVIAWFDRRGEQQIARIGLRDEGFGHEFVHHTGLPWDHQASVAKLCWLADQGVPITPAHRWLSVPEYLIRRFGGQ